MIVGVPHRSLQITSGCWPLEPAGDAQRPEAWVNKLLTRFQADLLGISVQRPQVIETTALGAVYLAGLATGITGVWRSTEELSAQWKVERSFHPTMPRDRATARPS